MSKDSVVLALRRIAYGLRDLSILCIVLATFGATVYGIAWLIGGWGVCGIVGTVFILMAAHSLGKEHLP